MPGGSERYRGLDHHTHLSARAFALLQHMHHHRDTAFDDESESVHDS